MEIELSLILIMAAIALAAGFMDAIAGGGGLITLPALLLAGIDPLAAIATNKLQSAAATVSATVAFARKGMIEWRTGLPMAVMAFIGGAVGAMSVSLIPAEVLQALAPVLLLAVATYFALTPKLNNDERRARLPTIVFCLCMAPVIGFYDGVFGPGTGSFFMVAFVLLLGQGILRAVCSAKLLNASCNVGALLVFSMQGHILLPLALAMAAGAFVGAQLGARCAVRFGAGLIKPLLIGVCCLMAGKLLLAGDSPWRILILG